MSCALGPALGVYNKEVLQRLVGVEVVAEVCQVVAKLHRLCVQCVVNPASQHRYFGSGVGITIVAIASILKVVERHRVFRLRGIQVLGHTARQAQL